MTVRTPAEDDSFFGFRTDSFAPRIKESFPRRSASSAHFRNPKVCVG